MTPPVCTLLGRRRYKPARTPALQAGPDAGAASRPGRRCCKPARTPTLQPGPDAGAASRPGCRRYNPARTPALPMKPVRQAQLNELTPSEHVPPKRHGDDAHSSVSYSQRAPATTPSKCHANAVKMERNAVKQRRQDVQRRRRDKSVRGAINAT